MNTSDVYIIVNFHSWRKTLAEIDSIESKVIVESSRFADKRNEAELETFQHDREYGTLCFDRSNYLYHNSFRSPSQKAGLLRELSRFLDRDSRVSHRGDKVLMIADEAMMNCCVSAKAVYDQEGLPPVESAVFHLGLELDENQLWIHAQDPFGVFFRKNFARSFQIHTQSKGATHGCSGKGLELIFEAATDMYIKSRPGWGTWVTTRIDLSLSNREHDVEPKKIFLDFK